MFWIYFNIMFALAWLGIIVYFSHVIKEAKHKIEDISKRVDIIDLADNIRIISFQLLHLHLFFAFGIALFR